MWLKKNTAQDNTRQHKTTQDNTRQHKTFFYEIVIVRGNCPARNYKSRFAALLTGRPSCDFTASLKIQVPLLQPDPPKIYQVE